MDAPSSDRRARAIEFPLMRTGTSLCLCIAAQTQPTRGFRQFKRRRCSAQTGREPKRDNGFLMVECKKPASDVARGARETTRSGVSQDARLGAAKAYIAEHCCRQKNSVGATARHIGITSRQLQRLFEADGTTFSAYLLGERLSLAYRKLSDPRHSDLPVSAIAYDVGFGDLSYFHRCFRRRYGATPKRVRKCQRTNLCCVFRPD